MSLIAGRDLDPNIYFKGGAAKPRGSSFDLTVGVIIGADGKIAEEPFILRPRQMVQVISAEAFRLPDNVTGHVTYKTALTKKGIWALTVGIVDPGWTKPITTTLLNFSKVDHTICSGDHFLRVSLFRHDSVPVAESTEKESYAVTVKRTAITHFPETFLDQERLAAQAGENVLTNIRNRFLVWAASVAAVITLAGLLLNVLQFSMNNIYRGSLTHATDFDLLESRVQTLEAKVQRLENPQPQPVLKPAK